VTAKNILKIKKAFLTLPNKKIIKIHNAAMEKPANRNKRIQITTKSLSKKQAIVLITEKYANLIIDKANVHVSLINGLLRSSKSDIHSEFIWLCPDSIFIMTNNVLAPSNLNIIKKYFKSIDIVSTMMKHFHHDYRDPSPILRSLAFCLSNLMATNLLMKTLSILLNTLSYLKLSHSPQSLGSSKHYLNQIWQLYSWISGIFKAKLLINHFFNFSQYITTIRDTNMNPGIP